MLDYAEKTFLVLSGASSSVSLCSFTKVMVRLWEKTSYSISLVFRISNVIAKMFSRAIGKKKISKERLLYWPEGNRRDISHDKFAQVMNEEQSYLRLKESIRAKDDELGDVRPNYKIY